MGNDCRFTELGPLKTLYQETETRFAIERRYNLQNKFPFHMATDQKVNATTFYPFSNPQKHATFNHFIVAVTLRNAEHLLIMLTLVFVILRRTHWLPKNTESIRTRHAHVVSQVVTDWSLLGFVQIRFFFFPLYLRKPKKNKENK